MSGELGHLVNSVLDQLDTIYDTGAMPCDHRQARRMQATQVLCDAFEEVDRRARDADTTVFVGGECHEL